MTTALWIIAICSLIRIIQNGIQLSLLLGECEMRKKLNNDFIDSLRKDNREWLEDTLKDFAKEYEKDEPQRDYIKCYSCNKFYDCNTDCEDKPQTEREGE